MKKCLSVLLALLLMLPTASAYGEDYTKFSHYFFGTFDTIMTLTAYARSEEEFQTYAELAETEMRRYHAIFDQYHSYDGVDNLFNVNQQAANAPVKAEPELIDLLLQIRSWQQQYSAAVNPALGSVLKLWHDARTAGDYVPSDSALQLAALHTSFDDVIIHQDSLTVSFDDPELSLDLGAVAKGYAAQFVAKTLREAGLNSFIFNAGGNVVCGGAPMDNRPEWKVAIEDVDGFSSKCVIGAVDFSVVTSGDYQRYYEVNGERFHHLIDPATLQPARHMRAVTILHPDSGLGDFLSTAAFLLPYESSRALIEAIPDAEAYWTLNDGTNVWTPGFEALFR